MAREKRSENLPTQKLPYPPFILLLRSRPELGVKFHKFPSSEFSLLLGFQLWRVSTLTHELALALRRSRKYKRVQCHISVCVSVCRNSSKDLFIGFLVCWQVLACGRAALRANKFAVQNEPALGYIYIYSPQSLLLPLLLKGRILKRCARALYSW